MLKKPFDAVGCTHIITAGTLTGHAGQALAGGHMSALSINAQTEDEVFLKAALKAGVKISFGTHAGAYNKHGTNADEFARMVESSMTPMDAIVAATINNAELFNSEMM